MCLKINTELFEKRFKMIYNLLHNNKKIPFEKHVRCFLGGLDIEIKHKSTRATKKSIVLRSAEYILLARVTVSMYEKNVAAYAWDPDKNFK